MKKFKLFWLSLSPAALTPLMFAASCVQNDNEKPDPTDVPFNEENQNKLKIHIAKSDEKARIRSYLDEHKPVLESKDPTKYNLLSDYSFNIENIKDPNLKFSINDEHYIAVLDSANLSTKPDPNKRTTAANHVFKDERVFIYKVWKLDNGKWIFIDRTTWSQTKPVEINFTLPENISTQINNSILKTINIDWDQIPQLWVDAKIVSWADGDTITFRITKEPSTEHRDYKQLKKLYEEEEDLKLRILGIDTPEKNVGKTESQPFEHQYAELSSSFGTTNFAPGTNIRIFLTGDKDTFSRYTGDFFFGDGYKHSYATEIVNHGFTLPLLNSGNISEAKDNHNSLDYYIDVPIANGFNSAMKHRRGFFVNFNDAAAVQSAIYLIKPSSGWRILTNLVEDNIYNRLNIEPDF